MVFDDKGRRLSQYNAREPGLPAGKVEELFALVGVLPDGSEAVVVLMGQNGEHPEVLVSDSPDSILRHLRRDDPPGGCEYRALRFVRAEVIATTEEET